MKSFLNLIFDLLGFTWNLVPRVLRTNFLTVLLIIESRNRDSKNGLINLLLLEDKLNWILNERAMKYGSGKHPKHGLIKYSTYFSSNIEDGERVADIGCSRGEVCREIAQQRKKCFLIGVDIDEEKITDAKNIKNPDNLEFICADATRPEFGKNFDVLIVSNVLEHIEERVTFLKNLMHHTGAKKILLRVPLFERDWKLGLRKELNINYYSDDDHKIEHTLQEFSDEVYQAGITIFDIKTLWGEIWAVGRVN